MLGEEPGVLAFDMAEMCELIFGEADLAEAAVLEMA